MLLNQFPTDNAKSQHFRWLVIAGNQPDSVVGNLCFDWPGY